jgi:hypothetical protein
VYPEQSVSEMVHEVLSNQAIALVERTGQTFESALEAISETEAGRRLVGLSSGAHRDEKASDWQEALLRERDERLMEDLGLRGRVVSGASPSAGPNNHYSWLEGYLGWLKGKEKRDEYYTLLERELGDLKGEGEPRDTTTPGQRSDRHGL